jgi:hypothetical protein
MKKALPIIFGITCFLSTAQDTNKPKEDSKVYECVRWRYKDLIKFEIECLEWRVKDCSKRLHKDICRLGY